MSVACIKDWNEIQQLAPEWNCLLARTRSNSVFLSWEWMASWWPVFGDRFELRLLTWRDQDQKLIGIAPLMIGKERLFRRDFRALMIIGQKGDTLAECLDFFVDEAAEVTVINDFLDYITGPMRSEWDVLFFERVLETSPMFNILRKYFPDGIADGELKSPFLTLKSSWNDLIGGKSRNFRNQWNNSWNRLMKQGDVKFLFAGTDVPLDVAMGEVARLHRQRWGSESASFKTDKYLRFHNDLAKRFQENGWLCLMLVAVNGEHIAARYDFSYGGKVWCIQGGWNESYDHMRVGTVLTGKVIEWGIQRGQKEYDFLGGDSDYKRRWADGERTMLNFTVSNSTTSSGRLHRLFSAISRSKQTVRQMLPQRLIDSLRNVRSKTKNVRTDG